MAKPPNLVQATIVAVDATNKVNKTPIAHFG
jgi:hypothetical protein